MSEKNNKRSQSIKNFSTGKGSTGYKSTGRYSTGNFSTGNFSIGDFSTGNFSIGDFSTGNFSTGKGSTGYKSTGHDSTGDFSVGYGSTGNYSDGDFSTGCHSTGCYSTGNYSTGYYSTGNWSISNYSSGHFSTEDYTGFGCFDKPCTLEEWNNWEKPTWLYFKLTEWIKTEDMTEKEKKDNPTYRTTGGYLKVYDYKEVFQASYNKATREEQLMIKKAPNFNADKFYQISGIKVDEEPEVKIEIEGKFYPISQIKKALSKLN